MKSNISIKKSVPGFFSLILISLIIFFSVSGCSENDTVVSPEENGALNSALKKMVENDEVIQSFEPNFSESEAMAYLGKTNTVIYPQYVWQSFSSISFDLSTTVEGDTAYGVSTKTFSGTLYIAANYNDSTANVSRKVDTVISKPFNAVVTRNIIFEKIDTTGIPQKDWKILAVSLPEGGTGSSNIVIKTLTLTLANGDSVVVTSPNEYYMSRDMKKKWGYKGNEGPGGKWKNNFHAGFKLGFGYGFLSQFLFCHSEEKVHLKVEVESAYSDQEYTALTFGADKYGKHKTKNRLELSSTEFNGTTYTKIYEGKFTPKGWSGFYHAVINIVPYHVINDDATPVESVSWGIPYRVQ